MKARIPTTIKPEKFQEFKVFHKKSFGIELSDQEAFKQGLHLLQFIATVYDISIPQVPDDSKN